MPRSRDDSDPQMPFEAKAIFCVNLQIEASSLVNLQSIVDYAAHLEKSCLSVAIFILRMRRNFDPIHVRTIFEL